MQNENNLIAVGQGMKSEATMNMDTKPALLNTWMVAFNEYRRNIGLSLWTVLLLIAALAVIISASELIPEGFIFENKIALLSCAALWVVLLFIAPFFVFKGLLQARHFRLMLLSTLLVATPFFIVNGLFHAHHMMTLGGAAMTQTEVPPDQMRVLWLSLALGDSLSFIGLTISSVLIFKYLIGGLEIGFIRFSLKTIGQLCLNIWFWLFVPLQFVIFVLINTPDLLIKLGGMFLFVASVLLLLASQDREAPAHGKRLKSLRGTGWYILVLVFLTFPVLYFFLNGLVADNLILQLMDMGAGKLLNLFEPNSPVLPFMTITLSKFLSQWLNLWPMTLILCAGLVVRGASVKS